MFTAGTRGPIVMWTSMSVYAARPAALSTRGAATPPEASIALAITAIQVNQYLIAYTHRIVQSHLDERRTSLPVRLKDGCISLGSFNCNCNYGYGYGYAGNSSPFVVY